MNTNRLINEKSPYLLQHAHNPVHWYPWGKEAFEKAQNENKPVFLSIGYSTCHWCHVMEEESFEDNGVAALLNQSFVAIKVDREERPDIDGIYMTVCQILTGSGGWPLTIFMTPDKKPFFAGTYFPKENRFGRSGIIDILQRIKDIWETRKDDVIKSAEEITAALNTSRQDSPSEISIDLLDKTYMELSRRYDSLHGGFGNAPKFPTPHNLIFLLRYWKRTGEKLALQMVEKTLIEMRKGGIYDHLGGGFHRYSTDRKWLVPHFEKMLYDQALIAAAYYEAYQATGNESHLNFELFKMTSDEGAFFSAVDADSEGVEGKFYLWTEDEVRKILESDADLFIKCFNIKKEGNWIDPMHGAVNGTNIIYPDDDYTSCAEEYNLSVKELKFKLGILLAKLSFEREKRIKPGVDDKILTDWNALMISSLAKGFTATSIPSLLTAAQKCAHFIIDKLTIGNKLLHRYYKGEAGVTAFLDDYAFFIAALIDLYESTFKPVYLRKALELMQFSINEFADEEAGGFFFTSADNKDVISRQKDLYDGAIPSGNSVMLMNLLRLGKMTNNIDYHSFAMKSASLFASQIKSSPAGYTYAASAIEFALGNSYEIIIAGKKDYRVDKILKELAGIYLPNKIVMLATGEEDILNIAPYLKDYKQIDDKPTIYVCRNYSCNQPVNTAEEMLELLK